MSKFDGIDIDEVLRRKASGETYRDMAKEFGVAGAALSRWVWRQTGHDPSHKARGIDVGKIKALYRCGGIWTVRAIAGDMALAEERVLQIVKELARRGELILREEDRDG